MLFCIISLFQQLSLRLQDCFRAVLYHLPVSATLHVFQDCFSAVLYHLSAPFKTASGLFCTMSLFQQLSLCLSRLLRCCSVSSPCVFQDCFRAVLYHLPVSFKIVSGLFCIISLCLLRLFQVCSASSACVFQDCFRAVLYHLPVSATFPVSFKTGSGLFCIILFQQQLSLCLSRLLQGCSVIISLFLSRLLQGCCVIISECLSRLLQSCSVSFPCVFQDGFRAVLYHFPVSFKTASGLFCYHFPVSFKTASGLFCYHFPVSFKIVSGLFCILSLFHQQLQGRCTVFLSLCLLRLLQGCCNIFLFQQLSLCLSRLLQGCSVPYPCFSNSPCVFQDCFRAVLYHIPVSATLPASFKTASGLFCTISLFQQLSLRLSRLLQGCSVPYPCFSNSPCVFQDCFRAVLYHIPVSATLPASFKTASGLFYNISLFQQLSLCLSRLLHGCSESYPCFIQDCFTAVSVSSPCFFQDCHRVVLHHLPASFKTASELFCTISLFLSRLLQSCSVPSPCVFQDCFRAVLYHLPVWATLPVSFFQDCFTAVLYHLPASFKTASRLFCTISLFQQQVSLCLSRLPQGCSTSSSCFFQDCFRAVLYHIPVLASLSASPRLLQGCSVSSPCFSNSSCVSKTASGLFCIVSLFQQRSLRLSRLLQGCSVISLFQQFSLRLPSRLEGCSEPFPRFRAVLYHLLVSVGLF